MWQPAHKATLPSREEVIYAKQAINELELLIKDAYELLEQIKSRIFTLTTDLEERRAWIAPIRKLPSELLSEIFVFGSEMEHLAPVTITEVSRLWRDVVLATPRAWSRIHIVTKHEHRIQPYISTFIARSDPCLLHICVPDRYGYLSSAHKSLAALGSALSRIQCLSIPGGQLETFGQKGMPNLIRLSITSGAFAMQPFLINHSRFPRLRSIHSTESEWAKSPSFAGFPPLTHLSLLIDRQLIWFDMLKSCLATLKALKLVNSIKIPLIQSDTITFPRLKSLSLLFLADGQDAIWPLSIVTPALTSYEEYIGRDNGRGTFHRDVKSVIYLRTNLVIPDLSGYVSLREYRIWMLATTAPLVLAKRLAGHLERDSSTCSALQIVEFDNSIQPQGNLVTELIKLESSDAIRSARPSIEVFFTNKYAAMPGSMEETSVSVHHFRSLVS
jgi:F-box-like